MRKLPVFLFASLVGFVEQGNATLWDRGGGLIYDDVLDVTWLQDANHAKTSGYDDDGKMTWAEATAWADQLVYAGYDDWRLPRTGPVDGVAFNYSGPDYDGSRDAGYNVSAPGSAYPGSLGSEMAYLYYNTLGNLAFKAVNGTFPQPGHGLVNTVSTAV